MMATVLFEYLDKFVLNYIDDILIYTKGNRLEAHVEHANKVLQKLLEHKLYMCICNVIF